MAGGIIDGILGEGFAACRHFKALCRRRQDRSKWSCSNGEIDMHSTAWHFVALCLFASILWVADSNGQQLTTSERKQASKQGTQNPEAYELYLKGRSYWSKRTLSDLETAASYFNQAIAEDPSYALAYSGLADSYAIMPEYGGNPSESISKANAAARKALELDSTLARPHAVLGHIKYLHDWDFAGGEAELKKAIELDPNDATPHQWYAESLFWLGGREGEALSEITHAYQLEPLSLIIGRDFGADHIFIRQYDEAIAICSKLADEHPTFSTAHSCTAEAYWRKRMYSQAIEEYKVESQISGDRDESEYVSAMEKGFQSGGWQGALARGIEVLKEQRKTGYSSAYWIASSYAELRDKEHAFDWLNTAFQEHEEYLLGKLCTGVTG
jgi:tetratricopeptide (TPR) repeat protein